MKKANQDSLLSERDQQVRVEEIKIGASSSRLVADNVDGGGDVASSTYVPWSTPAIIDVIIIEPVLVVNGTTTEDSGTQPEGPHTNVV